MRLFAPFVDCYFSNWNIYCSSSTHSIIAISRTVELSIHSLWIGHVSRLSFRSSAAYLFIYITDFWAWNVWPTTQMQSHHAIQCFFDATFRSDSKMKCFNSNLCSCPSPKFRSIKHTHYTLNVFVCVCGWLASAGWWPFI